jgi:hypothetical protein
VNAQTKKLYVSLGVVFGMFGVWWTLMGSTGNVKYRTVEGISVSLRSTSSHSG